MPDMQLMLDLPIEPPAVSIDYTHKLLLTGSCFTEHIGNTLRDLKFSILQNPNGILFDPLSVATSLASYTRETVYTENDLFYLNDTWNSWHHHSRFSGVDKEKVLQNINRSQHEAHQFLKTADWIVITLGSSFSYRLIDNGEGVSNCHRAPAQWFRKHLMSIEEINAALDNCLHQLFKFNPRLRFIFTVSPVRHIRDGVIDNNRSKARLIEVVHHLVNKFDRLYYFPAYEILIDVLRDYRFYDVDMVHPNYQATQYVLQQFLENYVNEGSQNLAREVQKLGIAYNHRAMHPSTPAHKKFMQSNLEKTIELQNRFPFLDMQKEIDHFSNGSV